VFSYYLLEALAIFSISLPLGNQTPLLEGQKLISTPHISSISSHYG